MAIRIVSDASPLIYFAKMQQLDFLAQVVGPVGIPPAVYQEAVESGQRHGRSDAYRIADAISDGIIIQLSLSIEEQELSRTLRAELGLGVGECETIACAMGRELKAILHDKKARRLAAAHHVRTMQAVDVLFLALLRGLKPLDEFKRLLRELAVLTGMDVATLLEREALAEEIAAHLPLIGGEENGKDGAVEPTH